MRTGFLALLVALLATIVACKAPLKAVIVSYPKGTPDSVYTKAKDAIVAAGGYITHEFNLIKAFSAMASEKVLETVQTLSAEYNGVIEPDEVVTINTDDR